MIDYLDEEVGDYYYLLSLKRRAKYILSKNKRMSRGTRVITKDGSGVVLTFIKNKAGWRYVIKLDDNRIRNYSSVKKYHY